MKPPLCSTTTSKEMNKKMKTKPKNLKIKSTVPMTHRNSARSPIGQMNMIPSVMKIQEGSTSLLQQ